MQGKWIGLFIVYNIKKYLFSLKEKNPNYGAEGKYAIIVATVEQKFSQYCFINVYYKLCYMTSQQWNAF